MAKDRTITGIDVGTSKITTLIASVPDEGELRIIGVSTVPSRGLKKGQIVNIEEATSAMSQSIDSAERMAGVTVSSAFISLGGNHIASLNSHGVVAVSDPDKGINAHDVSRVIDAAKAVSIPSSREILHVIPRGYVVDEQDNVVDPVGMSGVRLEVDTHIITAGVIATRNLRKCIEELGIEIEGIIFSGLASSSATITETEKELGVILIDIGGGTTDVAIFVDGALSYSSVIPIGAINITKDLAAGMRISLESAERVKLMLGQIPKTPVLMESTFDNRKGTKVDKSDELDLSELGLPEELRKVSRKMLVEGIIKPRLNEIFTMVGLEIKRSGFGGMTPSGIVLSGGGSMTIGAVEAAKRNLAMPVHIGEVKNITGLIDEIQAPSYTTSLGLLFYGSKTDSNEAGDLFGGFSRVGSKVPLKGLAGKVIDLLKSLLP